LDYRDFVKTDPRFVRPAEVDHLLGDASFAKRQFGWEPKTTFEQLVKMMVDADMARILGHAAAHTR
jgi:GDPmannose 4,6-dehydratase